MAGENPERLNWVRRQPCCLLGAPGHHCRGHVDAHHPPPRTGKGIGLRGHDDDAFPFCNWTHVFEWHAHSGMFKGWTKEERRAWERSMVEKYRELWEKEPREDVNREGEAF